MKTLYHGSHEVLKEIKDEGIFGGIFASCDEEVCLSHAPKLHKIELADSDILTQSGLAYEDYDHIKAALTDTLAFEEDEEGAIYSIVIENGSVFNNELEEARILEIFRCADLADASWQAQRIRGVIAKRLGYKAVEMKDEHGTTYLVLPGSQIEVA